MKKGFKNIWSLAYNRNKMELITGWSDGGLRKLLLRSYLVQQTNDDNKPDNNEHIEWNLKYENDKDFIRNILFINEKILCCTNMGCLYIIDTHSDPSQQQKFIFKSVLLSGYSVMSKIQLNNANHFYLAIGTLKGFIYLLSFKDEIAMECVNGMSMEEELAEECLYSVASSQPKICSLVWFKYKISNESNRYFLLSSYGFMDGLIHLYEFIPESFRINLIARLYLPASKHRWFTSFSIISINKIIQEDYNKQFEVFHLAVGDKCGNLYYYKLETNKSKIENTSEEEDNDYNDAAIRSLKLIKPIESFKNLTKDNSSISAVYSKNMSNTKDEEKNNEDILNHLIICCAKDGFYRVFELNNQVIQNEDEEAIEKQNVKPLFLKLINKYQINSYIDIIESFIFDDEIGHSLKIDSSLEETNFELESSLRLGFCFYSDKFLLWSFQSNRSLFDLKCGGANRSWDYEFTKINNDDKSILFRFIYVKNKGVEEAKKILNINEINKPVKQFKNHLCQIFHGNTITQCRFILSNEYLITGSEDTQLNITKIETKSQLTLDHQFHLQGHDSVVKCFDYLELNQNELLIVSAGGKANIKLWKALIDENKIINRIVYLYEFKRYRMRKQVDHESQQKNEKPWLYIDLKSNPDIRFMDVFMTKLNQNEFAISFACSDGCLRIFKYLLDSNKLFLINKFSYPKCLIGIRSLNYESKIYNLCYGTDGNLLLWHLDLDSKDEETEPIKFERIHQSGINSIDIWHADESSNKFLVVSGGDDTSIRVTQIDLSEFISLSVACNDLAHSSAIVGVKFLSKNILARYL
jgi:WD40 repeat protein